MTQHEVQNAVNSIKLKMITLIMAMPEDALGEQADQILQDIVVLERRLSIRHFVHPPNCRPVTADELQRLAASSNVVIFNPAA